MIPRLQFRQMCLTLNIVYERLKKVNASHWLYILAHSRLMRTFVTHFNISGASVICLFTAKMSAIWPRNWLIIKTRLAISNNTTSTCIIITQLSIFQILNNIECNHCMHDITVNFFSHPNNQYHEYLNH